jgi:hypothetical protein
VTDPKFQAVRRRLLASIATAGIVSGCALVPRNADRPASPGDDISILNGILALEYEAVAAYRAGAESGLLDPDQRALVESIEADHLRHAEGIAETIRRLGGEPAKDAVSDYHFTPPLSAADVLRHGASLERGLASADLGAVPVLGDRELAKAAGRLIAAETVHWTRLRAALGENPLVSPFAS